MRVKGTRGRLFGTVALAAATFALFLARVVGGESTAEE
jgi:hypothetical protein